VLYTLIGWAYAPVFLAAPVRNQWRRVATRNRWLLLIHQIPREPSYFRVKVWRRLQRLGAVAIKNSVYVMPRSDQALEDFEWVVREIIEGGGGASICEARFLEGLSDDEVQALFVAARDADYKAVAAQAGELLERRKRSSRGSDEDQEAIERLKRRLEEVVGIDFFDAPGRSNAARAVDQLATKSARATPEPRTIDVRSLRRRVWVTRRNIYVDRMASGWLIRRFVDPVAHFKFVSSKEYRPKMGELRFDMFGGEFTHEGDRCTFEVILRKVGIDDPGLVPIAQIVHDIDLKDQRFGRAEAAGIDRIIQSIAMAHRDDMHRLERSGPVFDDLYHYFKRKRR